MKYYDALMVMATIAWLGNMIRFTDPRAAEAFERHCLKQIEASSAKPRKGKVAVVKHQGMPLSISMIQVLRRDTPDGAGVNTRAALMSRGLIEKDPGRPGYTRFTAEGLRLGVELRNPIKRGWHATPVVGGWCEHGARTWSRWEWKDGEDESYSEPVFLEVDPCARCEEA